jgi:hypothetical protein
MYGHRIRQEQLVLKFSLFPQYSSLCFGRNIDDTTCENHSYFLFVVCYNQWSNCHWQLTFSFSPRNYFSHKMIINASRGEIQLDDLFNAIEHDKDQVGIPMHFFSEKIFLDRSHKLLISMVIIWKLKIMHRLMGKIKWNYWNEF